MRKITKPVDHKEAVVEVRNVSFSYGTNEVLHGVNLDIHRGDYLAIVGGNGSGKTTLLKIILGLLEPSSGKVLLFNADSKQFKDRQKIGYVRQHATNIDRNVPATVEEVVAMGRVARRGMFGRLTKEDYAKTREALEEVGMWDMHKRHIGDLSGGQQQRVLIARALVGEPEILFLDEPTVGVDKEARASFYKLLRHLNEEHGLTVVLITHDIESIAHEAMHIACIDCTLFYHESVEEYLKAENVSHGKDTHPTPHTHHV